MRTQKCHLVAAACAVFLSISSPAPAQGLLDALDRNVDLFLGTQIDNAGAILNDGGVGGPRASHNFGGFAAPVTTPARTEDPDTFKFLVSLNSSVSYDSNALQRTHATEDWKWDAGLNLQWAFLKLDPVAPPPSEKPPLDHRKGRAATLNVFSPGQTGWEFDILAGYGTSRYDEFDVLGFNLLTGGVAVTRKVSESLFFNLADLQSFSFDESFDEKTSDKNVLALTVTYVLPVLDGVPGKDNGDESWIDKLSVLPAAERHWSSDSSRDQVKPSFSLQYQRKQQKPLIDGKRDGRVWAFSTIVSETYTHFDTGRTGWDTLASAKISYTFLAEKTRNGSISFGVNYTNHQDDTSFDFDRYVLTPGVSLQLTY